MFMNSAVERRPKHIWVMEDNQSLYTWLPTCASVNSDGATNAFVVSITCFWYTDGQRTGQSSHFVAMLMTDPTSEKKINHCFITTSALCASDKIELFCRKLLRISKCLVPERKLRVVLWPSLVKVITKGNQACFNTTSSDKQKKDYVVPSGMFHKTETFHTHGSAYGSTQALNILMLNSLQTRERINIMCLQEALHQL